MAQEPAAVAVRASWKEGRSAQRPLGVIDLGSNTARLVIFGTSPAGVIWPTLESKEVPRLGLDPGADGSLSPEAVERGVEALVRFAAELQREGSPPTLAVATSAVRDAPNGDQFLARVRRTAGISFHVLSGLEEARYAYLGVASAFELGNDLVCDLGGGSLQLGLSLEGRLQSSVSLPLGALRLTRRFVHEDPPREKELDQLREYVRGALKSTVDAFGSTGARLYAVGGTIRALARASIDLKEYPIASVHGHILRARDLAALSELLTAMPAEKRRAIPGVGSDRADVIVPGLIVFEELLRLIREGEIVVSGTGIREGLGLEAIGASLPAPAETLVDRSVSAASVTLSFSRERARAMTESALSLFDRLAPHQPWKGSERLALSAAAGLHDAGVSIGLWQHAEHTAYLLQHYPVWGLSHREMLLAALVARMHEGSRAPPHWRKEFGAIVQPNDLDNGRQLAAVLSAAERLRGFHPKWGLNADGRALRATLEGAAEGGPPPRALEKLRKALERELDLTVEFRNA